MATSKNKKKSRKRTNKKSKLSTYWNKYSKPTIFGLVFAVIGSIFLIQSFAASNTVTYSGKITKGNPSQDYSINAGADGIITAKHNSKDANMRVAILDSIGAVLAEETGRSAEASVTVTPGAYSVRMDYPSKIKGAKKYKVTITYPVVDDTPGTPPPAVDSTPPTVIITSPNNDTISGSTTFAATANDNVGVTKVDFRVDGILVSTDTSSPYNYDLDSEAYTNGTHTLSATAHDAAGNNGSADISVTFQNEATPPNPDPGTYPSALWHADADTDAITDPPSSSNTGETRHWRRLEQSDLVDRLTFTNDPLGLYGKVYSAHLTPADLGAGDNRAEWAQMKDANGDQIKLYDDGNTNMYFGWRSLFGLPENIDLSGDDNDGNYMQLKGNSSCGGPAVGLTIRHNRLAVRTIDGDYIAWDGPLMTSLLDNKWHTIVLHVNFAKDNTGYVSVWLDGVAQTMNNGQTKINLPTVCPNDDFVFPKLGVYSMNTPNGSGPRHLIESPRIGTSYESVVPR